MPKLNLKPVEGDPDAPYVPETPPATDQGHPEGKSEEPPKKVYTFDSVVLEDIPDLGPKPNAARAAPWRSKWDEDAPKVLEDGKARAFYVPTSYYVDERGVSAEKATVSYVKQKLSDDWKKWTDADATRAKTFELAKGTRTGKEEGYQDKGPGVLVILKKLKT